VNDHRHTPTVIPLDIVSASAQCQMSGCTKCCVVDCGKPAEASVWTKGDPYTEWRVCSEHIEDDAETVVPYPYNSNHRDTLPAPPEEL
jgi:hypothetical protein